MRSVILKEFPFIMKDFDIGTLTLRPLNQYVNLALDIFN